MPDEIGEPVEQLGELLVVVGLDRPIGEHERRRRFVPELGVLTGRASLTHALLRLPAELLQIELDRQIPLDWVASSVR